ncbi:MAG: dUTPase [Bacteriophage sp.]|nr:MAG: dUTPase [Bacteriophage sp.]
MEVKVFKLKEIKLLSGDVVDVEQYCNVQPILPTYGKEGDACMDIYPICYEYDVDKDRFIYHTGLAFNIGDDANGEPNEMSLRPRSNLTKSDFYIPNSPSTIDWGYRGELLVAFKNRTSRDLIHAVSDLVEVVDKLRQHMHLPDSMVGNSRLKLNSVRTTMTNILAKVSIPPYDCNGEDRCAQLIINSAQRITWKEVNSIEELGETERGNKGFGEGTGGAAKS